MLAATLGKQVLTVLLQFEGTAVLEWERQSIDVEQFVNDNCPASSFISVLQSVMELARSLLLSTTGIEFVTVILCSE